MFVCTGLIDLITTELIDTKLLANISRKFIESFFATFFNLYRLIMHEFRLGSRKLKN